MKFLSKVKILAADSTKFGRKSFVQVSDLQTVDRIVTDREPADEWKQRFQEEEIALTY